MVVEKTIKFQKSLLAKLKSENFVSLLKDDGTIDLFFHDWDSQIEVAKSMLNARPTVGINTFHILIKVLSTKAGSNKIAMEYSKKVLKQFTIVNKQVNKYKNDTVQTKPNILKIHTSEQAILWNYVGYKCDGCNSWRVKYDSIEQCICLDCGKFNKFINTFRCSNCSNIYYPNDFKYLKRSKTKKCPECGERFTRQIIDYIRTEALQ